MGYKVKRNVGSSEFKMDIGIINPYKPEVYLMGILLDSENCKEAATARDRFVLQPSILKGLGWQLLRLWVLDWLDAPQKVLNNLKNAIEDVLDKAKAEYEVEQASIKDEIVQVEVQVADTEPEEEVEENSIPVVQETVNKGEKINVSAENVPAELTESVAQELAEQIIPEIGTREETVEKGQEPAAKIVEEPVESKEPKNENNDIVVGQNEDIAPKTKVRVVRKAKPYTALTIKPQGKSNDFYLPENESKLVALVEKILAKEAPINIETLKRKVITAWGFKATGSRIDQHFAHIMGIVECNPIEENGSVFIWSKDQNPETYGVCRIAGEVVKRDLDDIPVEEYINAAFIIIKEQGNLLQEKLMREVGKAFGFIRFTTAVEEKMQYVVDTALTREVLKVTPDGKLARK